MSSFGRKVVELRQAMREWESRCKTHGAENVEAQLVRVRIWRLITESLQEWAEEVGDATAGALSADEVASPNGHWQRIAVELVRFRAMELAEGR